jgi:hypothetical protein
LGGNVALSRYQHDCRLSPYWGLAESKRPANSADKAGNQTNVLAAKQGVVREGECNPESGGGYREFHLNDSLPAHLPIRRTEATKEGVSSAAAEHALNQIE